MSHFCSIQYTYILYMPGTKNRHLLLHPLHPCMTGSVFMRRFRLFLGQRRNPKFFHKHYVTLKSFPLSWHWHHRVKDAWVHPRNTISTFMNSSLTYKKHPNPSILIEVPQSSRITFYPSLLFLVKLDRVVVSENLRSDTFFTIFR